MKKNYDELVKVVCETLCDAKDLEESEVTEKTVLADLNLDSLDYVELMVLAKRECSATVSADDFFPAMTVGDLCQLLVKGQSDKQSSE